jgi:hypothetical protein
MIFAFILSCGETRNTKRSAPSSAQNQQDVGSTDTVGKKELKFFSGGGGDKPVADLSRLYCPPRRVPAYFVPNGPEPGEGGDNSEDGCVGSSGRGGHPDWSKPVKNIVVEVRRFVAICEAKQGFREVLLPAGVFANNEKHSRRPNPLSTAAARSRDYAAYSPKLYHSLVEMSGDVKADCFNRYATDLQNRQECERHAFVRAVIRDEIFPKIRNDIKNSSLVTDKDFAYLNAKCKQVGGKTSVDVVLDVMNMYGMNRRYTQSVGDVTKDPVETFTDSNGNKVKVKRLKY